MISLTSKYGAQDKMMVKTSLDAGGESRTVNIATAIAHQRVLHTKWLPASHDLYMQKQMMA
jgi:hypothetical protein